MLVDHYNQQNERSLCCYKCHEAFVIRLQRTRRPYFTLLSLLGDVQKWCNTQGRRYMNHLQNVHRKSIQINVNPCGGGEIIVVGGQVGKDNSGWSVGGGVLPTKAAQAGSQLGRKKNASCSGGCAKVNDGGTDVVGGGQGGGVLNTTAAPPCGFVIGYPRPPAVAALPSSESVG
eukprot:Em0007g961a